MLSFYSTFIKGLSISGCVLKMLFVCACKVVCTGKIFLCAHIKIVVVNVVQYGIDTGYGRYFYRTGRQSCIFICVVWAVYVQQLVVYAFD